MSDPRPPGELPPDLPPEHAEAYRRGYERAYLDATQGGLEPRPEPATRPDPEPEYQPPVRGPLFVDEYGALLAEDEGVDATQALDLSAGESSDSDEATGEQPGFLQDRLSSATSAEPIDYPDHAWAEPDDSASDHDPIWGESETDPQRRPGWFVPVLFVGLVVILVLGAYGIGRVLSSSVGGADVAVPEPDGVSLGEGGNASESGQPEPGAAETAEPGDGAFEGPVAAVTIGCATGSCQAPSSVDAAGNQVGYPPENAFDGDLTTAWRCNGRGAGESLTLTLAEPGVIAEVGLVPGYAKTDPRNGVDRYAENNRITRVRWTFSDGSSVVQRLDGSAGNRDLQTMRIKPAESDTVVLEVLRSVRGSRNIMAVSEIGVARVAE